MTIFAVFFEPVNGEIELVQEYEDGTLSAVIDADAPVGDSWIDDTTGTANTEEYYIADPTATKVLTLRPVLYDLSTEVLETDGIDIIDFALPTGTVVIFDVTTWTSTAAEHFQMTSTILGNYEISFDPPWPYVPLVLEVQCNAG